MTPRQFRRILDVYGADAARWPKEQLEAIRALLSASEDARKMVAEASRIDQLLDQWDPADAPGLDPAGVDPNQIAGRVTAQPQVPGARDRGTGGWRITLGWPNAAGLAAATAAGFLVGFLGLGDVWFLGPTGGADVLSDLMLIEETLW